METEKKRGGWEGGASFHVEQLKTEKVRKLTVESLV